MRAVSQQAGPKILRIGVVQGGKVVDERLIKQRVSVTIGPSEKAMFVVPSRKIPPNYRLFEIIGPDYYLNYLEGMTGRVALPTGVSDLVALKAQAKAVSAGGVKFHRVKLTEESRGKVVVGETTFLFQFVVPPPIQPKPQLPVSVRKGVAGDIDWFTTIVAAFSFLLHFFLVALVYSDWMDPVVDDEYAVNSLIESVKSLPPPPALEKPTADLDSDADADKDGEEDAKEKGGGKSKGAGKGMKGKGDAKAAADAKAAEIASALAELDVQTVGALGSGGVAIDGVLGSSEVPAGLLDEATRTGMGAGTGDPGGLKGLGGQGSGAVRPGAGGGGRL
ncbi:MAG: energy transducer TonB, partial [Deltaproteobacteria bacterium]|nr:energy transducer TonB [Deltaproteobacteria bacterium]